MPVMILVFYLGVIKIIFHLLETIQQRQLPMYRKRVLGGREGSFREQRALLNAENPHFERETRKILLSSQRQKWQVRFGKKKKNILRVVIFPKD